MDITRDVMQMARGGKTVAAMRQVIQQRYGHTGPSTDGRPGAQGGPGVAPRFGAALGSAWDRRPA